MVAESLPGIQLRVGLHQLHCKIVVAVAVVAAIAGGCIQTGLVPGLLQGEPLKDIHPDCWPGQWEADIDSREHHRIG